ncbi:MAG TPA: hypothetical protein VNI57_01430 [Candidatus Saccharimonadales bacterium]|nr:hypothetical protein [Candidatus Saccharimonadales bacterium]
MSYTDTTSKDRQAILGGRLVQDFGAIDADTVINQGDMLKFDTSAKQYLPMAASTDGAAFAGVAAGDNPMASLNEKRTSIQFTRKGVFRFKTTNSETYYHGVAVVNDTDAQTVRLYNSGGGDSAANIVGYVHLPEGGTVTGAAGTEIEVEIRTNYPAAGLA